MKKEAWKVWEDDVVERMGGDKVKASGMTDNHKGDVKTDCHLVDAKDTEGDGYSVSASFWEKLNGWARNEGREPLIAIRIEDDNGAVEIAVVSEIWYCEHHPDFEPEQQLKKQKQRKLNRRSAGKKPTSFLVGRYRLIAYAFDEFLKDGGYE